MLIETIAKTEKYFRRAVVATLPPWCAVAYFTFGRKVFLKMLSESRRRVRALVPESLSAELWGLQFRSPIFNAAGMFKHGEGYKLVASEGAGAYLCGTTTSIARPGNTKLMLTHPVATFPQSGASINWMGLPNPSHAIVARAISRIHKVRGCPVGASLGATPEHSGDLAIGGLISGMEDYNLAGADFLEINESCPNVAHEKGECTPEGLDAALARRLELIAERFLSKRQRNLPVIVKFSVDTDPTLAKVLTSKLIELSYDGVNFGNTSTDYEGAHGYLNRPENKVLDYFTSNFGGGLSGAPLREKSLKLVKASSESLQKSNAKQEFHILRTGGVESAADISSAIAAGASLCQWFAGYFSNFAEHGHDVYQEIYKHYNEYIRSI